ncbi:hypothetical protein CHARACLAT_024781 [Characodon lateralis]|uniref:Uncharacterized protein n=1 Tax=Characodon lateralis TaxID=208331 RepID=A0ABU7DTX7_9TELE|nr:hypothetical protein [Characodon lateralis]
MVAGPSCGVYTDGCDIFRHLKGVPKDGPDLWQGDHSADKEVDRCPPASSCDQKLWFLLRKCPAAEQSFFVCLCVRLCVSVCDLSQR